MNYLILKIAMYKYCAGVNLFILPFGPDMQESQLPVSVTYVCINGFGHRDVNKGTTQVDKLSLDSITAISRVHRCRIRCVKKCYWDTFSQERSQGRSRSLQFNGCHIKTIINICMELHYDKTHARKHGIPMISQNLINLTC